MPAAAAAPAQQKIRIKLKSYWVDLLHDAVDKIQAAAADTGASIAGPVPLPTRKKVYTVLRSPHVNKDSREQFEVRLHQRLIDIKDLSSGTIDRLMSLDLPAGVDIEVGGSCGRPTVPLLWILVLSTTLLVAADIPCMRGGRVPQLQCLLIHCCARPAGQALSLAIMQWPSSLTPQGDCH